MYPQPSPNNSDAATTTDGHVPAQAQLSADAQQAPAPRKDEVAVLLIHGFTGARTAMRPWAQALEQAGYHTQMVLLPGHETRWQDMVKVPYAHWIHATEQAFDELAARYRTVFVAGLSMGGALALHLATRREVAGLLLTNPGLVVDSPLAPYTKYLRWVVRSTSPISNDIALPGADEQAYPRTPVAAVAQLHRLFEQTRRRLPLVTCPIILFRSASDNVVSDASVRALFDGLAPNSKIQRVDLPHSLHVATLDYDAPLIFERSAQFIATHTPART